MLADRMRVGNTSGSVLLNGQPRGICFKRACGYVMQSDALFANLTVREMLAFTAEVCARVLVWARGPSREPLLACFQRASCSPLSLTESPPVVVSLQALAFLKALTLPSLSGHFFF